MCGRSRQVAVRLDRASREVKLRARKPHVMPQLKGMTECFEVGEGVAESKLRFWNTAWTSFCKGGLEEAVRCYTGHSLHEHALVGIQCGPGSKKNHPGASS